MKPFLSFVLFFILFVSLTPQTSLGKEKAAPGPSLEAILKSKSKDIGLDEKLKAPLAVMTFYQNRNFTPAWGADPTKNKQVKELLKLIGGIQSEGLDPSYYHFKKINLLLKKASSNGKETRQRYRHQLDIFLTDATLALASHLAFGLMDPDSRHVHWFRNEHTETLVKQVQKGLDSKKVVSFLKDLIPKNTRYTALKEALTRYEEYAQKGEWVLFSKGSALKEGDSDVRVRMLRKRLASEGFLKKPKGKELGVFDAELAAALKKFQELRGLEPDGVLGYNTAETLNISVKTRLCQIKGNLDRLRALERILEPTHILVNIPEFALHLVHKGKEIQSMKVITGRSDRKTPLMSNNIKYLVFSPSWHVPYSIAVKDKLPKIIKDPEFIFRNNMQLSEKDESGNLKLVDPLAVDWTQVTPENFPFHITQRPGDGNALGQVKFMFPNKDNVYLHDTSEPHLFKKTFRSFSSGCVRVEKPVDLAKYLLKDKKDWDQNTVTTAMERGLEKVVSLNPYIPIHLYYYTAWGTENNEVAFRPDVYGYDRSFSGLFCKE